MKKRLDVLLSERGMSESREKARAVIMSGIVFVNGLREDKPGTFFEDTPALSIELRGSTLRYVSRGGLKLEKALEVFHIDLSGVSAIDIGASTGGFTDCMLQHGAASVCAVDTGYGQMSLSLRLDPRVTLLEKTNARYLKPADVDFLLFDFAAADVSFISLAKILPAMESLLSDGAKAVLLIKPQFEAGREEVGKKGVVRDPRVHGKVIRSVASSARELGLRVLGIDFSPLKGPEGNIEYLLCLAHEDAARLPSEEAARLPRDTEAFIAAGGERCASFEEALRLTVAAAHETLG